MADNALLRVLTTLDSIGTRSGKRQRYVTSFLAEPFRSYKSIADRFGINWRTARYHIQTAAAKHPEIRALVENRMRKEIVRKRAQKKGKK